MSELNAEPATMTANAQKGLGLFWSKIPPETRKGFRSPADVQMYLFEALPGALNASVTGNEVHAIKSFASIIANAQKFGKLPPPVQVALLAELTRLLKKYAVPNSPAYPYLSTAAAGLLAQAIPLDKDRLAHPDTEEAFLKAVTETLGNPGLPPHNSWHSRRF
jgi:hypothetical protein